MRFGYSVVGVLLAGAVGAVAATAAGPAPGVVQGSSGLIAPGGNVRYVSVAGSGESVVEAVSTKSGRIVKFGWVTGAFGIPMVAYDGTPGGLSRDGKTLVLAPAAYGKLASTRFLLLNARTLKVRDSITLAGTWSYDALSPDGRTLYLIQYVFTSGDTISYRVRAYDLAARQLLKQVIADKREQETTMAGSPVARATSRDGNWVYTLYATSAKPFIHALDAAHRGAICIDLPWKGSGEDVWKLHLSLSRDGTRLLVHRAGGPAEIVVDTTTHRVTKA